MKTTFRNLTLAALLVPMICPSLAHGAPKMARVNMQKLFRDYHRTEQAQKQVDIERARIQKENNERMARIKASSAEADAIQSQLDKPGITDKKKQLLFNEWQQKNREQIALERERKESLQRRNQALNEKLVQRMKGILEEIGALVEETAKMEGYNAVFDHSGHSTSQTPFLIYSNLDDLTPRILALLNKDAPEEE